MNLKMKEMTMTKNTKMKIRTKIEKETRQTTHHPAPITLQMMMKTLPILRQEKMTMSHTTHTNRGG
jgi:hypothetical protein